MAGAPSDFWPSKVRIDSFCGREWVGGERRERSVRFCNARSSGWCHPSPQRPFSLLSLSHPLPFFHIPGTAPPGRACWCQTCCSSGRQRPGIRCVRRMSCAESETERMDERVSLSPSHLSLQITCLGDGVRVLSHGACVCECVCDVWRLGDAWRDRKMELQQCSDPAATISLFSHLSFSSRSIFIYPPCCPSPHQPCARAWPPHRRLARSDGVWPSGSRT